MSKPEHGDKQPLKRRVFYFDIKTSQNRNKLKNYITRLGGTVGEFLDNRVKYLITDRNPKDWPVKDKNTIKDEPNQTPETPSNRVSDLLPRGRQLALRASAQPSTNCTNQQQSSKTISDVIEIAHRRGIKILEAQAVLDFCSLQIRQLENPNCDTPKTSPRISRATVRQFKGAFIKLEDVEQKYRPSAKEFKEWPKIYFDADPFMCPFIPPSKVKKFSENNDGHVANTVETGGMTGNENNNGTNNNNNNTNTHTNTNTNTNLNINNNSNISINININPSHQLNHTATGNNNISSRIIPGTPEIGVNYGMNTKTFEGLGIQTPKASTNATNDFRELNRPTPLRKQNAIQYCEICGITFKSISEHINSTTHQSHIKQKENFKDLFSVIKSLPKWTDICQENEEIVNPSDTNDCSVEFEYPHYPSLTPPSMPSTTITLTPCSTVKAVGGNTNTKGSFLPLHDYISKNNNNNSKNGSFKVKEINSLTATFKMRPVNILGNLNNINNLSNIANNININKISSNFKILNSNYSYSNINNINNNNNNSKNLTDIMNASKPDNCKIVNDSRNINNFEQLFSDDEENINEDEIEASCFTPPLIPPLLYPELDIPEEILRQKTNTIRNDNDDCDAYSLEF